MSIGATPSQTIGPFFSFGLDWMHTADQVSPDRPDAVVLHGTVVDGDGVAVPDAMVEAWQPGCGFGRCLVDAAGHYRLTVAPAPAVEVTVFARGLLNRLVTRCYLPGTDRGDDPVLALVPPERQATLLATADDDGYRFDIRLQGPGETVFFAF